MRLFTIGHSNHSADCFQRLLSDNGIEVLVDVRSWPHSRYVEWVDRSRIADVAKAAGAQYLFLGKELGGRPESAEFYDATGHVLYGEVAKSVEFRAGIERLRRGAGRYRVAVMCSEENPATCHRRLLVAKVLLEEGLTIGHIRGDGRCEVESEPITLSEGSLFDDEESLWRSSLSVSRRQPPKISSAA
ncbi:MAG TPA: DUF488 domain-containing protein [Solirubrobacterales bacterium]|nr:DUF488 domain-containing protein [Solirubrobacterales bacterium]